MRSAAVALLAAGFLAAANARAQGAAAPQQHEPIVRPSGFAIVSGTLEFRLGPGAERCPGEDYFRQEVSRR